MAIRDQIDRLRSHCWDEAVHTFATAVMFERRARRRRAALQALNFLGIGAPVTLGGIILSFGRDEFYIPALIIIAGVIGVVQLVASVWSLVAGWQDDLSFSVESVSVNYRLSDTYKGLGAKPPVDLAEFQTRVSIVDAENQAQSNRDNRQGLSTKEKRAGLRAALHQFQRACVGCKVVPTLKATSCQVCGTGAV